METVLPWFQIGGAIAAMVSASVAIFMLARILQRSRRAQLSRDR
jgi:hypothetical protein